MKAAASRSCLPEQGNELSFAFVPNHLRHHSLPMMYNTRWFLNLLFFKLAMRKCSVAVTSRFG
jgi:hypothetical protein